MSNLAKQIREALAVFARNGTEPAFIGGLAVEPHQVVRASEGLDLFVHIVPWREKWGCLFSRYWAALLASTPSPSGWV